MSINFYVDIDRDPSFRKNYGAHFTPIEIVKEMCSKSLDILGIDDIRNFKFLDLASGTGVFSFYLAKEIEKRYKVDFEYVINACCVMAEFDPIFINKCREIYRKLNCSPYIIEGDALFNECIDRFEYDLVIGNPPYVRIQNLEDNYRKKIQKEFISCSFGSSDIYLAFIERGINLLNERGTLALITPSSYLRSETGINIRKIISDKVVKIKDFGSEKKFNCGAYTSIIYAKNNDYNNYFLYELNKKTIKYSKSKFVNKLIVGNGVGNALSNFCKIRGGIATLRDKIFIIKPENIDEKYAYIKDFKIELKSTKKFVKLSETPDAASVYNSPYLCIFPYKNEEDGYRRYEEKEFKFNFPETFKYLLYHKDELLKRDKGKNKGYKWFEYGRTQGLTNIKECIVTSTINRSPNFFKVNLDGYLFSSGLALYDLKLKESKLLRVLNSLEMEKYIEYNGSKYSGGWRGYNKRILSNFSLTNAKLKE